MLNTETSPPRSAALEKEKRPTVVANYHLPKGRYKCPTTGARVMFGELGLKLMAAHKTRVNYENIDETWCGFSQHTHNYNNQFRNFSSEVYRLEK